MAGEMAKKKAAAAALAGMAAGVAGQSAAIMAAKPGNGVCVISGISWQLAAGVSAMALSVNNRGVIAISSNQRKRFKYVMAYQRHQYGWRRHIL
jgi:hypothetical protein